MITIDDIKLWAKPHPIGGGTKHCCIFNNIIEFSIVGGGRGLYGDFETTFEVAIFSKENDEFITKYLTDGSDDVLPYMNSDELIKLINNFFKNEDFQVR